MLLFPLLYLCFLVPFGDALVPALQMVTAVITIHLTRLSGIDAAIDGVFIDTPAGLFEVAEACSGVKFLVAMAALGVLVAYACFRSPRRRAVFLAAAFALPILANGVRAWGTIAIAQALGIEFAQGFDHVVYGWVFFALVVAALLAASWRWFERVPEETGPSAEQVIANPMLSRLSAFGAPLGLVGGAAVGLILLRGSLERFCDNVVRAGLVARGGPADGGSRLEPGRHRTGDRLGAGRARSGPARSRAVRGPGGPAGRSLSRAVGWDAGRS